MLPDDLVGSVSFETLRAGVPRENVTFWIQHENRMRIADALNEEPERVLASLFSPSPLFSVAMPLTNLARRECRYPLRLGFSFSYSPDAHLFLIGARLRVQRVAGSSTAD